MHLEKIISLANQNSELRFLAMVRSLRAAGCNLPVWVIPYDEHKFNLPENCIWWEMPLITEWIKNNNLWPAFKKIQCLTEHNYQFVDSDIIFLKNPESILKQFTGFVTCCTHWNNPNHTFTKETLAYLKEKTTIWQKLVFNSGQWACDEKLFEESEMINFCERQFVDTLFTRNYLYKDQAGINILVNVKASKITNITLPPYNVESSWAGDYTNNFKQYWVNEDTKPYLLHWAGCAMYTNRAVDCLFTKYLSEREKILWNDQVQIEFTKKKKFTTRLFKGLRAIKNKVISIAVNS